MLYSRQDTLTTDENPNGGKDYSTSPFLKGESIALAWNIASDYGVELHRLYPAWSADPSFAADEGRCWYQAWYWSPSDGYTATGAGSVLLPFEEGVRLFLKHDVFAFGVDPDSLREQLEAAPESTRKGFRAGELGVNGA